MKTIKFNKEVKLALQTGIDTVANAVKTTLGAQGRVVVISRKQGTLTEVHITKDGVTVAREVELMDPVENVGANIIKSVATKTVNDAGDGTTTACILAQAIFNNSLLAIEAGANPVLLKKQIDAAVKSIVEKIKQQAIPVQEKEMFHHVAMISSNQDKEIADIVTEAFEKTGMNGLIHAEESKEKNTQIKYSDGYKIDRGYISNYFITNPDKRTCELENCDVFIYNGKITNHQQIMDAVNISANARHGFLLICEDINPEAIKILVEWKMKGALNPCVIRVPSFGDRSNEILEDVAILTHAKGQVLINNSTVYFGNAGKVIVENYNTTFINGAGSKEAVKARIETLNKQLSKAASQYEEENISKRIAYLNNGVAIISVGGNSELEMKERKDRFDDTVKAVKAASEEGVLPGGGTSLLKFIGTPQNAGEEVMRKALQEPFLQLCENAGADGEQLLKSVGASSIEYAGYDVNKEELCNMFEAGIIDPAKVIRTAIENSASVASLLITGNCMIVEH